jgi:membrane fusion protein, multidrug efflux system
MYIGIGQMSTVSREWIWARTCWAIGNFREGQLQRIVPGMQADVYVMSKPNLRFAGVVDSVGFGVTPDPDIIGTLQPGLPDVQRILVGSERSRFQ